MHHTFVANIMTMSLYHILRPALQCMRLASWPLLVQAYHSAFQFALLMLLLEIAPPCGCTNLLRERGILLRWHGFRCGATHMSASTIVT